MIFNYIYININMNLYTNDNPITTLKGLGFKNKETALDTINKVESYFNNLLSKQKIPGFTPKNVLPKKKLDTNEDAIKYYQTQKLYRILGMMNRAKGMIHRVNKEKQKNFEQAIKVFKKWIDTNNKKK